MTQMMNSLTTTSSSASTAPQTEFPVSAVRRTARASSTRRHGEKGGVAWGDKGFACMALAGRISCYSIGKGTKRAVWRLMKRTRRKRCARMYFFLCNIDLRTRQHPRLRKWNEIRVWSLYCCHMLILLPQVLAPQCPLQLCWWGYCCAVSLSFYIST